MGQIAKDGYPPRHVEISLVKVKVTHLMNNNLPLAAISVRRTLFALCNSFLPYLQNLVQLPL